MNDRLKSFISVSLLLVLFCFLPSLLHAQPDPGDCPDPDVLCPVDGGLSLLVAAGVGYGIKKWKGDRKNRKVNFR